MPVMTQLGRDEATHVRVGVTGDGKKRSLTVARVAASLRSQAHHDIREWNARSRGHEQGKTGLPGGRALAGHPKTRPWKEMFFARIAHTQAGTGRPQND